MNAPIIKETVLQRLFKHPGFKNPNSKGPKWPRPTLLHKAAEKGVCDVMRVLLDHKDIDVNSEDGFTGSPLMVAAENGQVEAVRLLLQHKDIAVNHRFTFHGYRDQTALSYAKSKKHDGIVDLLLSHGAIDYDANASSTASTTAHIDNPQSTTLQAEHETQSDSFNNCMDDVPNEVWEEFLDMEDEMDT
jgi:ankyrin repeat protein